MKRRILFGLAACLVIAACAEDGINPLNNQASVAASDTTQYLPYGIPAPTGVLTKSPRPYTPQLGAPKPNSIIELNIAGRGSVAHVHYPPSHGKRGITPPPGNGDAGLNVVFTGINVRNDAETDLSITQFASDTAIIYAPTQIPDAHSCIEATTVHRREPDGKTHHYHGFWNWCAAPRATTFSVLESMNSTWLGKYTRLYAGYGGGTAEPSFYTEIHSETPDNPIGGCWVGMLYNFNTGYWEQKFRSCGTSNLASDGYTQGWTMWESAGFENHNICQSLPSIKSSFIRKQNPDFTWGDTSWSDFVLFQYGYCWATGTYTLNWPVPGEWQAHTPN